MIAGFSPQVVVVVVVVVHAIQIPLVQRPVSSIGITRGLNGRNKLTNKHARTHARNSMRGLVLGLPS